MYIIYFIILYIMYSCVCVCVVVRMNVLRGRWRFRKRFPIDGAREVVGGERYECGVIRGSRMHFF
jgi:hypothetical protein